MIDLLFIFIGEVIQPGPSPKKQSRSKSQSPPGWKSPTVLSGVAKKNKKEGTCLNVKRKDQASSNRKLPKQKKVDNGVDSGQRIKTAIVNALQESNSQTDGNATATVENQDLPVHKTSSKVTNNAPANKTSVLTSKRKLGSPEYPRGKGSKQKAQGESQSKQCKGDKTDNSAVVKNNLSIKDKKTCDNDTASANAETPRASKVKSNSKNTKHTGGNTAGTNLPSAKKTKPTSCKTNSMTATNKRHRTLTNSKMKGSSNSPSIAKRLARKKAEKRANDPKLRASEKLLAIAKSIQLDNEMHDSTYANGECSGLMSSPAGVVKNDRGKCASRKTKGKVITSPTTCSSPSPRGPYTSQDLNTTVKTMTVFTRRSDSCSPVVSPAVCDKEDTIFSTPPVDNLTTSMEGKL